MIPWKTLGLTLVKSLSSTECMSGGQPLLELTQGQGMISGDLD